MTYKKQHVARKLLTLYVSVRRLVLGCAARRRTMPYDAARRRSTPLDAARRRTTRGCRLTLRASCSHYTSRFGGWCMVVPHTLFVGCCCCIYGHIATANASPTFSGQRRADGQRTCNYVRQRATSCCRRVAMEQWSGGNVQCRSANSSAKRHALCRTLPYFAIHTPMGPW